MDLFEKMATYVRVIDAGSFSAAAKQLRLSSAAVSRQIATLERDLGVTLLARSTRRMAVTEQGRTYYERCLRVLLEVESAQAVRHGGELDGPLNVSAPVGYGLARIVPHVASLMLKHPGLRLDLRLEDRFVDLVLEGVDLAVRAGSAAPESSEIVASPLTSYRRIIVASPAYLSRRSEPKSPEALAKYEALTQSSRGADTWTLLNDERAVRVALNVIFRSNTLFALRDLALAGLGIAMFPDWFIKGDLKRRALRPVLPGWRVAPIEVNVLYRAEHRGSPRVRAFVEHLRAANGIERAGVARGA